MRIFIKKLFPALIIMIMSIIISCQDNGYDIEYQDGYPTKLAGNWIAYDYQLNKSDYLAALDTINKFDLSYQSEFDNFLNLIELNARSDKYDLVTALDPENDQNIIFNNIYNSGYRTRVVYDTTKFSTKLGEQLNKLTTGGLNVNYISLSGQLVEDSQGDILFIILGLYDNESALIESLFITAYRKTGFEDTDYQSLLGK